MRLMHLGLTVHIVGETTTPAIGPGDVLLVASGSGTTGGIIRGADSALGAGATVVAPVNSNSEASGAQLTMSSPALCARSDGIPQAGSPSVQAAPGSRP